MPYLIGNIVGGCVGIYFLTFWVRKLFVKRFGIRQATVIGGGVSVLIALVISTLTGMDAGRFIYYPLGAIITIPILLRKSKS